MGDGRYLLRLREVASSWFTVAIVVLVLVGMVGGYATLVAYTAPGSVQSEQTVEEWRLVSSFDHSATVTRENPAFPVGETLENRQRYYRSASPTLDVRFLTSYRPRTDAPANVSMNASLLIQSVGESTTYWSNRTTLKTNQETVNPGGTASLNVSLNTTQVRQRTAAIRDSLGGDGTLETVVVVNATAHSRASGSPTTLTFTRRLSLANGDATYSVSGAGSQSERVTTTETVSQPRDRGVLWKAGGPLAFLTSVALLGLLVPARLRGSLALSDVERERLRFLSNREEFDEWVVRIDLPASVREREYADADSLGDLVDFAIDSGVGVVEDRTTGAFYAVTSDLVVRYEPPEDPETRGSDPLDLQTVYDGLRQDDES
ncbi:DUF5305 family protein [Salarchaeum japonicum]|uniref:DUF5305 family protein n=1 Tax=Salarchaeum japonicum TaxID=555573 RepID=UPI003C782FA0